MKLAIENKENFNEEMNSDYTSNS